MQKNSDIELTPDELASLVEFFEILVEIDKRQSKDLLN